MIFLQRFYFYSLKITHYSGIIIEAGDCIKFTETESVELKERLNDSFVRKVVSFLNTNNGTIYIGVTDDGEVIGIDSVDETLKSISNIIVDSINPSCKEFVKPMALLEEGKLIVKVEVGKGLLFHYISNVKVKMSKKSNKITIMKFCCRISYICCFNRR